MSLRRAVSTACLVAACVSAGCEREPSTQAPHRSVASADDAPVVSRPDAAIDSASPATDATPADAADPATWRLPGQFSAATTEAWLRQRFGDANVRVADVPGGEGETSRGILLFPDDPSRRAYLYFQDAQQLRGLSLVRVMDPGSHWRLDNGIGIGTPLSTLVAMNGKPIRFSGFDWDYGGGISDWNGGRLEPAGDQPQRPIVRLTHGEAPPRSYPMGDAVFSSDDPQYPHLGDVVSVGEIGMSFPGEDDL